MPSNIYDTYAAKICRFFDMPPGTYDCQELRNAIIQLPLAESHMALDGREATELPKLGDGLTVQAHMQANFFDVIGLSSRQLFEMTKPVLVRRERLERLEGWLEWRTLQVLLEQEFLEPALVFRNTPVRLKINKQDYLDYHDRFSDFYVADVRVLPGRPEPFVWAG